MGIKLNKGQKVSLDKQSPGLTNVFMGLGWDPAQPAPKKKGFFGSLLGGGGGRVEDIDLDASVIVLDEAKTEIDIVSFGKLTSDDRAIKHGGDNLTGAGDGDDEVIYVNLPDLDPRAKHLVFTVNSFGGQTFNEVDNAVARLVDDTKNAEVCSFTLNEHGAHTGVIMASLSKGEDGWSMTAHGVPGTGRMVRDLVPLVKSIL